MQVRFKNGKGVMYCEDMRREDSEPTAIEFPIESLPYWYPISLSFHYVIGNDGELYIDYAPNMIDSATYGLQDGDTDGLEFPIKLDTSKWYCEPIAKENEKILSYGKHYKIPTLNRYFDNNDIQDSIDLLQRRLDKPLYEKLEKRYLEGKSNEEVVAFRVKHDATRSKLLLSKLKDGEDIYLRVFGCLRIWLNVLKRIEE